MKSFLSKEILCGTIYTRYWQKLCS